jgi:hypothetical protein
MVGMRERLGGRLRPRTRFDERRVRSRSRGDEVDIDGPVVPPIAVDHQLDMTNKLLIRPWHPPSFHHRLVPLDRKSHSRLPEKRSMT